MFEFHGWATLVVNNTTESVEGQAKLRAEIVSLVSARLKEDRDPVSRFEVYEVGNDMIVLTAQGLRNHRRENVIVLFEWIARQLPDSYGLLYVHDDEQRDHENEFRVWRLARGRLNEQSDPFLSPCIPTLEDPYCGD